VSGKCILEPTFVLTEVHRQALDSNILRLATDVTEGRTIQHCEHDDFVFRHKRDIHKEEFLNADKIICGYNNTRRLWNERYRKHIGYNGQPRTGDKLICLQNNHKRGLYNGMAADVIECKDGGWCYDMLLKTDMGQIGVKSFKCIFDGHVPKKYIPDVEKFDFGYVLSCHKSQGSEWDNVVVYNEPVGQGIDRQKWLYTAISRAKSRLVLADR
jgi:exodeoxyribonuclease-5